VKSNKGGGTGSEKATDGGAGGNNTWGELC